MAHFRGIIDIKPYIRGYRRATESFQMSGDSPRQSNIVGCKKFFRAIAGILYDWN
jgi:hypothetical protein